MNHIDKLKKNLNEQQLEAVTETEGFVRVIAGAGSGKTKALTHRYAYIVEALGINSSNILCVTFTNKAAQEMRKRVKKLVGENSDLSYITTYHGFCVRILREDINKIKYPKNFIIMDVEDQKTVLRQVYNELGLTSKVFTFKQALRYISKQKSSQEYLQYILESKKKEPNNEIEKVFIRYLEKQQRNFALDFDDLLNFALYIFENNPDVLNKWQKRLHYIQVDETQDSSQKQFRLIEILSQYHKNLFVVGDPDQTIYEWRGAKPEILVDFDQQFVDSKTIIMNQNYRSTPNILSLGNHIIKNNKIRVDKDMFTQNPEGVDVVHFHGKNDFEEGLWVANEIKRLVSEEKFNFSDFAILYRANHISRSIEQSLIRENISYTVFGGIRFFERKEIKDVLAYLRLIEFEDDFSFLRVVNTPSRGLGRKFIENVARIAEKENISLYSALKENISNNDLGRKGAIEFIEIIEKYKNSKKDLIISDLVKEIMDESGLSAFLRADGDTDRLDNIKELQNSIILLETQNDEPINLTEYLQEIALYTDMDLDDDRNDKVKLMTIHTSKGLEFPIVFLCGFTEGVLPSAMSIKERRAKAIEEERRLTYVAITRAEKAFYMTESEGYNFNSGMNKYPSRFLFEISDQYFVRKGQLSSEIINEAKTQLNLDVTHQTILKKFKIGDIVNHPIWKRGNVIEVNEDKAEYQIEFKELGKIKPINFEFKGLDEIEKHTNGEIKSKDSKLTPPSTSSIENEPTIKENINKQETIANTDKLEVIPIDNKENKIDQKIKTKIKRFAKKEFPNDKEMQHYTYENQVKAFLHMELATDEEVKSFAIKEYKHDYEMQQHVYDKNITSKKYMASVSDEEVKQFAIQEYDDDYEMQQHIYDKNIIAKKYMESVSDIEIRDFSIQEFKDDFEMQQFIYDKQYSAKKIMSKIPNSIAKEYALRESPNDYDMQIYIYNTQNEDHKKLKALNIETEQQKSELDKNIIREHELLPAIDGDTAENTSLTSERIEDYLEEKNKEALTSSIPKTDESISVNMKDAYSKKNKSWWKKLWSKSPPT